MPNIVIYTTDFCPYCIQAKKLFDAKGAKYTEIRIDLDNEKKAEMMTRSGRRTVPQIFINEQHIGGCDDLYALNAAGKLDSLLQT